MIKAARERWLPSGPVIDAIASSVDSAISAVMVMMVVVIVAPPRRDDDDARGHAQHVMMMVVMMVMVVTRGIILRHLLIGLQDRCRRGLVDRPQRGDSVRAQASADRRSFRPSRKSAGSAGGVCGTGCAHRAQRVAIAPITPRAIFMSIRSHLLQKASKPTRSGVGMVPLQLVCGAGQGAYLAFSAAGRHCWCDGRRRASGRARSARPCGAFRRSPPRSARRP